MNIPGHVFRPNQGDISKSRFKRYNEIKHLRQEVVKGERREDGRDYFSGNIGENKLSYLDIALLCDKGSVCFGGKVNMMENEFSCTIWTD